MRVRLLMMCLGLSHLIVGASSDGFYFTVSPNDQDVEEGQPLRLRCAVTPSKDIYYSWLHNGERVDAEQEYGRRYLETDGNLQIPHADRELDQGIYQCQALNRSSTFATASKEAKVNVYWMEPDVQVKLMKPNKFEDIRFGAEIEFTCQAKANPPLSAANIKWYHNGNARLPNTEFLRNGNLRIAVLGMEHTGSYHCRVIHAAGKLDSRPPFVIQFDDASSPGLIHSLPSGDFLKYVTRGRSVELVCPKMTTQKSAENLPLITVWGYMQRLGEQQQSTINLPDIKLTDMDSKLVINNFDIHHANYYTCEISWHNSPDKYIFLFQVEMSTLFTPKRSDFSPRLKKNQPYVVKINDDAELRYYSDHSPSNSFFMDQMSNPAPNIEWRRKGDPQPILEWEPPPHSTLELDPLIDLAQTPRIYVLRGRHLVVRQVSEDDSGTYEMILTNLAGRVSVTFDLLVTYPPEFFQPLTLSEHAYDEDEPVSLNCGVKRRTVPGSTVVWEKDQRLLKKHKNSLMTFDDNDETLHFPKLKPEDQGHYQCFVQTDGYKNRAPGRETRLIVKGKLQFLREFTEHFLELNTQGRIPCKARGYGTLQISWYRKYGPLNTDLHPIRPPNQVEADGTLIIPFVQKSDSGEYMCVAQSTYKDASINMTIQVLVGEKPKISQISINQTVRIGSQLTLNCHATGDPPPQISWIAKRAGFLMYTPRVDSVISSKSQSEGLLGYPPNLGASNPVRPVGEPEALSTGNSPGPMMAALMARNAPIDQDRVRAFANGSLIINHVGFMDQAEYICVASNKHAVETRQGVFVRVLSAEEYTRRQLGAEASGSGMLKTILTVVGCAVAYLGLIIALTVFCSMRMVRARRKRSPKALKIHENGQLLTPGGEPNGAGGMNGTPQNSACGPGNAFDSGLHMTGAGSGVSGSGATSFGHVYAHHTPTLLSSNTTAMRNGVFYAEGENLRNTGTHASITPTGLGAACLQAPSGAPQDSHDWRSWNTHGYFCPSEQQSKVPHGTPAGPLELTSESNTESVGVQSHGHMRTHPLHSTPCGYPYTHRTSGADNSTNTTTASEPLLMSAPPPTPLDSRSHFSGISSGNSTSLYSRSLLSGASNTGLQAGGASHSAQTNGDIYGPTSISQADRMHYPRSELQIEGILGKGIFGDIFLARARNIQEDESQSLVLVKSLASHESTHINEFHRQLELFGKLNHEHVTRLLGICMEQEPFYMLLEYCEWGDLKMFLRRIQEGDAQAIKPLTLTHNQKLDLCRQLAQGMEHLSLMRCVHRDLAARNLLLTQDLELKISSLGLCRNVHAAEYYRIPNTDRFIPLRWFAPELIAEAVPNALSSANTNQLDYGHLFAGPSLPYSVQSDVWAFAVVVCEIFSLGATPLARLTDQEIITAGRHTAMIPAQTGSKECTSNSNPAPLKPDVPADIPPELSSLLTRCWSPNVRHRPDFRDISATLHKLMP